MSRRALIIGIDEYEKVSQLNGCVNDANAIKSVLEVHEDGSPNYDCRVLTSDIPESVSRSAIRKCLEDAFRGFDGDVVFYFSGHGAIAEAGGFIVTQDGQNGDIGIPMDEILLLANKSSAKSVLLILDCCFSGNLGNPASLQASHLKPLQKALLREGVTILAASKPSETVAEIAGHGVFTDLVIGALSGGAADVRGRVSAASIYAYVEQALGPWDQRPIYKSHANTLDPIRVCSPSVVDSVLRELPKLFGSPTDCMRLDPSYEYTHDNKSPENIEVFNKLKKLRNARLLQTEDDEDLYYVALNSKQVMLSPLGQFYWKLAERGRI